jgi:hypothetical protein
MQVNIWRRSYDIPPPPLDTSSEYYPGSDPRYQGVPKEDLPLTESLKITEARPVLNRLLLFSLSWWTLFGLSVVVISLWAGVEGQGGEGARACVYLGVFVYRARSHSESAHDRISPPGTRCSVWGPRVGLMWWRLVGQVPGGVGQDDRAGHQVGEEGHHRGARQLPPRTRQAPGRHLGSVVRRGAKARILSYKTATKCSWFR